MYCQRCGKEIAENAQFCQQCGQSSQTAPSSVQVPGNYIVPAKNKRLGIIFIAGPFALLFLIMLAWAVIVFFAGEGTITETWIKVVQWVLGFLGLISVLGIFVGIVLGIIFLSKKELDQSSVVYDQRSGQGDVSEIPDEIEGWNWGAAGLTFIWGVYYNVWISLLAFVPVLSYVWWIVMGIKGNEWAWQKTKWQSVAHFQQAQNKWKAWGIAVFVLAAIFTFWPILYIIIFLLAV